jgi:hypothetical protein
LSASYPEDRCEQVTEGFAFRCFPEYVEAAPNREVFYLAEVAVYVVEEVAELFGLFFYAEVAVEFGVAEGLPDLGADGG